MHMHHTAGAGRYMIFEKGGPATQKAGGCCTLQALYYPPLYGIFTQW